MRFSNQDRVTTFDAHSVEIIARPALSGAWLEIRMDGRAGSDFSGCIPIMGWFRINATTDAKVWPKFELMQSSQPQPFRSNYDDTIFYASHVSYSQIEAFEKERNAGEFSVSIAASLRVINPEGRIEDWHVDSGTQWNMNSQKWLDVLSQAGYRRYMFNQISFPVLGGDNEGSTYYYLGKAREYFDSGLYRQCIVCLRQAEEKLRKARNDQGAIREAQKAAENKVSRESMLLRQRIMVIRNTTYSALHAAPHADEMDSAFERAEAKALLIIVSALVELFPEPDAGVNEPRPIS